MLLFYFIFNSIRGRLGSILMLSANTGFLVAFLAGHFLNYHTIPYIGIVISVFYAMFIIYFPETPVYLLRKKNERVILIKNSQCC